MVIKSRTLSVMVEEIPVAYALSIGVTPETGRVGDSFRFVGILTVDGRPMEGVVVQLVLEGVGVVGEDVTESMGNYDITWVADRAGTLKFHAEAPGVGALSSVLQLSLLVPSLWKIAPMLGSIFMGVLAISYAGRR